MTKQVMILMSDTGGGHRASAEALRDGLIELYGDGLAVDMVDLWIKHTPPPINRIPRTYRFLINDAPWLFRFIYEMADHPEIVTPALAATSRFLGPFIARAIRRYHPDLIVSVHPLMQDIPIRMLRRMHRDIPFATVVTDLVTIPGVWFDKKVTRCFVPSDEGYRLGLHFGMRKDQLVQHGLPIRPAFARPMPPRAELRARLDLDPHLPCALIVSGGEGMGPVEEVAVAVARRLARDGSPLGQHDGPAGQIVVICGRNQRLEEALRALLWPVPARIEGFVERIWEYMAGSDCIITKAGPGTIAESAALGLPVILSGYVRGQESGNVPYVLKHGMGVYTEVPEHIAEVVHGWFTGDHGVMAACAANARRLGRPEATLAICRDIVALLGDEAPPERVLAAVALPAEAQ